MTDLRLLFANFRGQVLQASVMVVLVLEHVLYRSLVPGQAGSPPL
jgi:hypothetical protein